MSTASPSSQPALNCLPTGRKLQDTVGKALNEWYQAGYSNEPVYGMPTFSARHTPTAVFEMLSAVGAVQELYGEYLRGESTTEQRNKRTIDEVNNMASATYKRLEAISGRDIARHLQQTIEKTIGPAASARGWGSSADHGAAVATGEGEVQGSAPAGFRAAEPPATGAVLSGVMEGENDVGAEVEGVAEVLSGKDEVQADAPSDDEVEEVAAPLPSLAPAASSLAGGDLQVIASGVPLSFVDGRHETRPVHFLCSVRRLAARATAASAGALPAPPLPGHRAS